MKWLVLADDLTGAADAGLQFAAQGLQTVVGLPERQGPPSESDVFVVDTENRRREDPRAVRQGIGDYWRRFGGVCERCFLKIDSTMRGHIGVELDALMGESNLQTAVITPAYPQQGRTVVDGVLYVHGEFHGSLVEQLAPFTRLPVHTYRLADLRHGRRLPRAGVIAADAETPEDLQRLVAQAQSQFRRCLWAGSAGLAQALAPSSRDSADCRAKRLSFPPCRYALAVVGSQNSVSQRQVETAKRLAVTVFRWDPSSLMASPGEAADAVFKALKAERAAVAALTQPSTDTLTTDGAAALGELMAAVMRAVGSMGLFLTGGDTAYAVCQALKSSELRILGGFAEGVPVCQVAGGTADGGLLITKAGGFGGPSMLYRALDCLRRGGEVVG